VQADIVSVVVRALSFIALFQAAGMAMFIAFSSQELTVSSTSLRRIGTASALIAAVLVAAHYALEAARMSGDLTGILDPSLQSLVLHSAASVALSLRLAGLLLLATGFRFVWLSRGVGIERSSAAAAERHSSVQAGTLVPLAGAVLVLLSFTAVGHTAAHPLRELAAALLFVHVAVVAFWFGALVPLHVVSLRESPATAAHIVARFSSLAVWLVPGLFLAGLLLTTLLLPDIAALNTPYGRLLIAKVAGFAVLMALASLNKWRLGPALARNDSRVARTFRRSLAAELALIVAVLSLTAVLTTFYSPDAGDEVAHEYDG
jgi:copper resistance protein D